MESKWYEQFVTYEQALSLRGLEFDEPCFVYYRESNGNKPAYPNSGVTNNSICLNGITTPTYSQAFKYFKSRFKLSSHTDLLSINHLEENYYYQILNFADIISPDTTIRVDGFKTQEEAESACLDKLIQFLS